MFSHTYGCNKLDGEKGDTLVKRKKLDQQLLSVMFTSFHQKRQYAETVVNESTNKICELHAKDTHKTACWIEILSEEDKNASQSSDYYYVEKGNYMTADLAISGEPGDMFGKQACSITLASPPQSVT
jgi:hypothetical protein